jgi:hypothetical protein
MFALTGQLMAGEISSIDSICAGFNRLLLTVMILLWNDVDQYLQSISFGGELT